MTKQPVASGTFSDIWRGIYNDKPVAVKALRGFKEDDARKVRKITRPMLPVPLDTRN